MTAIPRIEPLLTGRPLLVRIQVDASDHIACEMTGIAHRSVHTWPIPLSTALRLRRNGVPTVLRRAT